MSISHAIPKDAKFRPTKNVFSAPFLAGNYDFNIPANSGQTLLNLIPNTVYFIDNFSFAGNISKENFLSAIVDFPQIVIGRKMDRQSIYDSPITLTQFYEDKAASAFMTTKQDKDEALITLKAKLKEYYLININDKLFKYELLK